jgi:hypothetical protein
MKYPGEAHHKDFMGKMRFRYEIDAAKRDSLLRQLLRLGHLTREIQSTYQELHQSPCPIKFSGVLEEAQALFEQEKTKLPNWKPY